MSLLNRLFSPSSWTRAARRLSKTIAPASNQQLARLTAEPWYVDEVVPIEDGMLQISGWAFQDGGISPERQADRFLVNARAPHSVSYPLPRPDVQKVFWQRANAELCGFVLTAPAAYPDGVMEVACHDTGNTKATIGRASWFLPDPERHINLPDADRRFRVIGNRDPIGFLRLGATDALRLKAAFENVTGKAWDTLPAVLDWGVGCGRVARHLAPSFGERFFGCDIDADNIRWCNQHLSGSFKASRLEPPLPYPDASFDLIYGVSVFTHLRGPWEVRWLEELHRVLRPGGTLLVTVHGQTAVDFAGLDPVNYKALMDRVEREGIAITSTNNQLDGFVEHPEEYVNVFHSVKHIQSVWGSIFSNIQRLPGYIFTHDLVVATKS